MEPREVKQLVSQLQPDQLTDLKDELQLRCGVNQLLGKPIDKPLLHYTIALINGDNPREPYYRERRQLNGRVQVTRVSPEEMNKLWR